MGHEIIPASPPPPGVVSNFTDPENIAWIVHAAIGAALPLSIITCSLRLYTSKCIGGRWHVDDGMIALPYSTPPYLALALVYIANSKCFIRISPY